MPILGFSQITINESDKRIRSSTKIIPKKETVHTQEKHTQEEAEQVKEAIKKMNMRQKLEVCDCQVVLKKTIDYNSNDERKLYFKCTKLAIKYKVKTNAGLDKWYDDEKKGGCY